MHSLSRQSVPVLHCWVSEQGEHAPPQSTSDSPSSRCWFWQCDGWVPLSTNLNSGVAQDTSKNPAQTETNARAANKRLNRTKTIQPSRLLGFAARRSQLFHRIESGTRALVVRLGIRLSHCHSEPTAWRCDRKNGAINRARAAHTKW